MLRAYSKLEVTGKRRGAAGAGVATGHHPTDYAELLLTTLGAAARLDHRVPERHPALVWAESGAMSLTGPHDGPPALAPGRLASCARGAVRAFAALAGDHAMRRIDGAALLGERAAILDFTRRGRISCGGSCRLLRARDGWIAVNLPRADDHASVPAWLELPASDDSWDAITDAVAHRPAAVLVARARLLGLAAAAASRSAASAPWYRVIARGASIEPSPTTPALVLDLSALWAGPLASHLLERAGARVIKVESTRRPDGARSGAAGLFDLLNAGKESVALDPANSAGRAALMRLVTRADIVIEGSRPRALAQLGIDAATIVRDRPGMTWISITGYGRSGPAANWIAYGDDAATAAGLAIATGALVGSDGPLFCGDAIADPLTGMHAAVAALAAYRRGGGVLLSLALHDVAAHALAFGAPPSPATVHARPGVDGPASWDVVADGERQAVQPPRARRPTGMARPLGSDTDAVLGAMHGRH